MICPKCGAGLTGTKKGKWWCKYCALEVTTEKVKSKSLDEYIQG